ncbi:MAG: CoA transferase [Deltaproteobacteria bacterium]|nr:CoA transferase [Deltaproteobacteria bacterium]
MKSALDGVRVLELCNFIAGPYAAMLLADMGAEVIKVENPKGGDPFRSWDLGGDTPTFWSYNRGKKSVTLNLQVPEGREIFYQLCPGADVVIENYRPGVTKKLGIDYESLRRLNEKLIYCSITGMGSTGPYAHRPAYDTVGQGLGGMMSLLLDPKNPRPIGPNYSDSLGGMFGAIGVLGALYTRAQTGHGQFVETSMVGATLAFLISPATECLATGEIPGPTSRPRNSQTYAFSCSDGLPFAIHLSSPPKFWEGLCKAAGHPELIDDPRFKTRADRRRNYEELQRALGPIMKEKPRSHWLERLEAEDVPHTPVYNMAELFQDPHIKHMGLEIEITRNKRPPIRTVRFPIDYSETKTPHPAPPPELGEHNSEFFKPLGYDEKRLAELKEKGVI